MNQTAILHVAFGVLIVAGFLVSAPLSYGLYGLGAACFIAGIVLARQNSDEPETADSV
ncbi:hypothetical protein ACODNH_21765 [Haloarcula sp. NS06]|uniref:hypothetical protein n=1 Tax=unclassified Haloarcula TaxID=2624677 RepID=UPI0027B3849B|nr:hypothetical protein [Haloarcula sp. H-GB4]MDQ2074103.1 hypothetical protein [Haloarcula sp. H-GB4]